jgi:UDP-glucose 4-epimerase
LDSLGLNEGDVGNRSFGKENNVIILVTGGTGLVGSRLLRRFVSAGVDCRALVRPGKELPPGAPRAEGDLFDIDSLARAVEGVSAIVHLAAVFRTQNEEDIWRANLDGTKNLIAAAKSHAPQARFVMASTGLVYDEDAGRPGLEDDEIHPKLAYPASKIAAENELRQSGLNWTILRLPFVYGDGDGHLISILPHAARLKLHPATTFSLGHQRDVARAIELALTGAMDRRIVNVVDDAPATLYEMASIAGSQIEPSAEPLTNPWRGRMDGSRLRGLGFQPEIRTLRQAAELGIL